MYLQKFYSELQYVYHLTDSFVDAFLERVQFLNLIHINMDIISPLYPYINSQGLDFNPKLPEYKAGILIF
jgi:hypothetical protein